LIVLGDRGVGVGEEADVVDRDVAVLAAEAEEVEGEEGEGVGGDGGEVDRDCPGTGETEGVGPIVAVREVGEVGGGGAVELAAVLEVEEAVGLGQVADGADEGLKGLGVEQGDFKGVARIEGALVEVGVGEGELEGFGSVGDDEGLAEVGEEGIVFAEGDGGIGDLDAATGVPLGEQLVELAVGDADHGGGVLVGANTVGEADAAVGGGVAQVGEHLEFEWAGELSHTGGEVGAHEFSGIGEVAAILGEGGAVAVALEGGGAGDIGDAAVVGGVATDQAREVAEFVEDGGEEVVVAVGGGAEGGAEEGFRVQGSKFRVFPGGAVDEPAEAVGVGVEGEGAGDGAACGVEVGDVGFGKLACREI
jgi:hypothetical protein